MQKVKGPLPCEILIFLELVEIIMGAHHPIVAIVLDPVFLFAAASIFEALQSRKNLDFELHFVNIELQ